MSAADVVVYLLTVFPDGDAKKLNREGHHLAQSLLGLLLDYETGFVDVEEKSYLEGHDDEWTEDMEEYDDSGDEEPMEKVIRIGGKDVTVERAKKALDYYRSAKSESRTWQSMHEKFRFIGDRIHIDRLLEGEKRGFEKMIRRPIGFRLLGKSLFEWTQSKIEQGIPLHDADLQSAALRINDEHNYVQGVKGSPSWILSWKKAHRITSRKIIKFVAKVHWKNKRLLIQEREEFVRETKALIAKEGLLAVQAFNCDQSGCVKELYSNRTLSLQEEKKTEKVVTNVSATSHSFTLMPMLFASGALHPFLYVVLAEKSGTLPTRPPPYSADNLVLAAGKSHIMTRDHMTDFVERVIGAIPHTKMLMIADAWPSSRNHSLIQSHLPPGKTVLIRNLPAGLPVGSSLWTSPSSSS